MWMRTPWPCSPPSLTTPSAFTVASSSRTSRHRMRAPDVYARRLAPRLTWLHALPATCPCDTSFCARCNACGRTTRPGARNASSSSPYVGAPRSHGAGVAARSSQHSSCAHTLGSKHWCHSHHACARPPRPRTPALCTCAEQGHSLGGAQATLAAWDVATLGAWAGAESVRRMRLVTFGSPRVGNKEFATAFNVVCVRDVVGATWRDGCAAAP